MEDLNNWQDNFEECCYAKKLLDKIAYLNGVSETEAIDIIEVKKAIHYAKKYHGSQMRQSGEPFYSHPIEVAYMLATYTALSLPQYFRTDLIITAILHDTIEDTELTESIIVDAFDTRIASQVADLTRIRVTGKISAGEMVKILYTDTKIDLLLIKLCDRFHNLQTLKAKLPQKAEKTIMETLERFMSLSMCFGSIKIEQDFFNLCSEVINDYYKVNN